MDYQLNRKEFICQLLAGTGALMMPGCSTSHGDRLPNIVMIISDDQGWGDYGFMGSKNINTPNLDRLAANSVVFSRGYVVAPLCGPSCASIITGLHPHQHKTTSNDPPGMGPGVKSNTAKWPEERRKLREEVIENFKKHPALPGELKKAGYSSLQTGKWWMGHYSNGGFTNGMTHGDMDRGGRHGDEGLKIGRETMQPLSDFLDQSGDNPFFIWYAPMLPHTPHNPPERLLSRYRDKTGSIHIARYHANCEWFDETCGQLLDMLEQRGLTENTLILYACDNGWIQNPDKGGFAARSKRTPYEGGIRTPVMVSWPAKIKPEFDKSTVVSSIDLAPTVMAACGMKIPEEMEGVDLLDRRARSSRSAVFGAAYTHDAVDINDPSSSLMYLYVIEEDWKLIMPSGRNGTGKECELYNVVDDPGENINLASAEIEKTKKLKERLEEWWPFKSVG